MANSCEIGTGCTAGAAGALVVKQSASLALGAEELRQQLR